jgi:hypothetical protein
MLDEGDQRLTPCSANVRQPGIQAAHSSIPSSWATVMMSLSPLPD